MKKFAKWRAVLFTVLLLSLSMLFVACNKDIVISFDTNGGTEIESMVVDDDFEMPSNPTKSGYVFDGWYTDAALTKPFAALDYANPVDISLYAKYTKTDGGSSSSDSAGGETSDNSGCGSVAGISAGFVILAAGAAIALKKKK